VEPECESTVELVLPGVLVSATLPVEQSRGEAALAVDNPVVKKILDIPVPVLAWRRC